MKLYDRTKELEMLRFALEQSRKESRMTVVTGRRRIGKTELIKRCGDDTILYFFVARKTEALLCMDFVEEAEKKTKSGNWFPNPFFRFIQNETDLIAVNEIDNTAEIYEIKRDKNKFDKTILDKKINHFIQNCPQIKKMTITSGVLSLEDM